MHTAQPPNFRPPPKKGGAQQPPLFGQFYCDQTAGWIKMSLGTEVGPLWGQAPLRIRAQQPPLFVPFCCSQTARWTRMPLGTQVGYGPGDTVLDGDPAPPTERGTAAPHFSSHVYFVSDIAIFVLKRDVKLQLTNSHVYCG